jgi:hypothetical protein
MEQGFVFCMGRVSSALLTSGAIVRPAVGNEARQTVVATGPPGVRRFVTLSCVPYTGAKLEVFEEATAKWPLETLELVHGTGEVVAVDKLSLWCRGQLYDGNGLLLDLSNGEDVAKWRDVLRFMQLLSDTRGWTVAPEYGGGVDIGDYRPADARWGARRTTLAEERSGRGVAEVDHSALALANQFLSRENTHPNRVPLAPKGLENKSTSPDGRKSVRIAPDGENMSKPSPGRDRDMAGPNFNEASQARREAGRQAAESNAFAELRRVYMVKKACNRLRVGGGERGQTSTVNDDDNEEKPSYSSASRTAAQETKQHQATVDNAAAELRKIMSARKVAAKFSMVMKNKTQAQTQSIDVENGIMQAQTQSIDVENSILQAQTQSIDVENSVDPGSISQMIAANLSGING